ncbi:MAG: zinc metallopeptidase [Clostridia bacterium]|nr:zinc metallopeptidase [Clostridia bacterium]
MIDYIYYLVAILICAIISGWASRKVHSTYAAYASVRARSNMTGYDTAVRLLRANDIKDVRVDRVRGTLTDHYHPSKGVVNLSQSTYGDTSVAAVAVAAHEIGHVVQKKKGYLFYTLRSVLVPVVNFGARLALPLVLVGLILDLTVYASAQTSLGYYLAIAGVALYGASFLFTLVTLPVELNASKRAANMLVEEGVLADDEVYGAKKVLSAAAMTYLASMLTSLVYFLRFLTWVLAMFGRRRR